MRGNTRLVTTKSEIARIGSLCTAAPSLKKQKQKKKKKDIINCVGLYYEKVPVESISYERKI